MAEYNAGEFRVSFFTGGYPVSITINHSFRDKEITFTHKNLPDLLHVLKRAQRQIHSDLMDKDKHEVMP